MSAESMADEALRALERGAVDRAEGLLRDALAAARREARRDLEVRTSCALGELLVTTGEAESALQLFQHALGCLEELPTEQGARLTAERRTARRYLNELAPTDDPELLEWGD